MNSRGAITDWIFWSSSQRTSNPSDLLLAPAPGHRGPELPGVSFHKKFTKSLARLVQPKKTENESV